MLATRSPDQILKVGLLIVLQRERLKRTHGWGEQSVLSSPILFRIVANTGMFRVFRGKNHRYSLLSRLNGGEGGIRTLGTGVSPYNGLANRRIRPLCHLSGVRIYSLPRLGQAASGAFAICDVRQESSHDARALVDRIRIPTDQTAATCATWNFFTPRMPITIKITMTINCATRNGGSFCVGAKAFSAGIFRND